MVILLLTKSLNQRYISSKKTNQAIEAERDEIKP